MRQLLDYFSDEFWPYVVDMAEDGEFDENLLADDRDAIIGELSRAFRLWRRWLGALYEVSPSHLDAVGDPVGDPVATPESWFDATA